MNTTEVSVELKKINLTFQDLSENEIIQYNIINEPDTISYNYFFNPEKGIVSFQLRTQIIHTQDENELKQYWKGEAERISVICGIHLNKNSYEWEFTFSD